MALFALASSAGTVYFGLISGDVAAGTSVVVVAVTLAQHATALATVPGLLRGSRTAWLVALGYEWSFSFWTVYKVTVEGGNESLLFLGANLAVVALLLSPATRRRITS
jgi:hypothetical protein